MPNCQVVFHLILKIDPTDIVLFRQLTIPLLRKTVCRSVFNCGALENISIQEIYEIAVVLHAHKYTVINVAMGGHTVVVLKQI